MPLPLVDTRDANAVEAVVLAAYNDLFSGGKPGAVSRFFAWAADCFHGRVEGYQPVDTRYHDFEHTLQGTLCLANLLSGRARAGAMPALTASQFELTLLAILLHDSGYLKENGDVLGTGAKYTAVHVDRSGEFAGRLMRQRGFSEPEVRAVQNMIHCTGMRASLEGIPFQEEWERTAGSALATADFLGQMAAPDYVEKLPVLYAEFEEAWNFEKERPGILMRFDSAQDLIRRTPGFWQGYVKPKLERDFGGLFRFLNDPFPDGPNAYLQAVERNVARLSHGT